MLATLLCIGLALTGVLGRVAGLVLVLGLVAFLIAYAFIFGFGSYYLAKLLRKGPEPLEEAMRGGDVAQKPKRPLSAVNESLTPA